MKIKKINESVKVQLLKKLIDQEYNDREELGKELHGKKSYLSVMTLNFGRLERELQKSLVSEFIAEQKQIIAQCLTDLQEIRKTLYPAILSLSGLVIALNEFVLQFKKQNQVDIQLKMDSKDEIQLSKEKDIGIYSVYVDIVTFLTISGYKKIVSSIGIVDNAILLEVKGESYARDKKPTVDNDRVEIVKAKLLWRGANVLRGTNWKSKFKIKFPKNLTKA